MSHKCKEELISLPTDIDRLIEMLKETGTQFCDLYQQKFSTPPRTDAPVMSAVALEPVFVSKEA